jgi:hypothetical protein
MSGVGYTGESFVPNEQDLKELVALVDFRIARTTAAYNANVADVSMRDPNWLADWTLLLGRVADAKTKADPATRPVLWTERDSYEAVMRAVQQVDRTRTKGDLSDLMSRLGVLGHMVDETGSPQPDARNEPALRFLKWTNEIPTPGQLVTGTQLLILGFLVYKSGLLGKLFRK